MDKYEKLTRDLMECGREAYELCRNESDWGTCNFDSPTISPKGFKFAKLEEAIKNAGYPSYRWRFGGTTFVICTGGGQGERRTMIAETVCKLMRERGYAMGMYYRMD